MELIVITREELREEIISAVKIALESERKIQPAAPISDWITVEEAKKILPLKSKTSWQSLRNKNFIRFTQVGRKIMYSRESLKNYVEIFVNKAG